MSVSSSRSHPSNASTEVRAFSSFQKPGDGIFDQGGVCGLVEVRIDTGDSDRTFDLVVVADRDGYQEHRQRVGTYLSNHSHGFIRGQ